MSNRKHGNECILGKRKREKSSNISLFIYNTGHLRLFFFFFCATHTFIHIWFPGIVSSNHMLPVFMYIVIFNLNYILKKMLFDFLFRFLKSVTVIRMGILTVDASWWIYDLNRRQSVDEYKIWSSSFKPRFMNFTKRHCCIWNVVLGLS